MAMIAHRLGAIFGISCDHSRPYSNIGLMGARKRGRKMRPEMTWRSTFHGDMKEIWYSTDIANVWALFVSLQRQSWTCLGTTCELINVRRTKCYKGPGI